MEIAINNTKDCFKMQNKPLHGIRIVACEDDEDLRDVLMTGLSSFGFAVDGVSSAEALDTWLTQHTADILLLDIGLPKEDGFSVAARLCKQHPELGIIIITAKGEVKDRVQGMIGGADLYFVKPVDLRELTAAIHSLFRRITTSSTGPRPSHTWRLNALRFDLQAPSGTPIDLTENELRVLSLLMAEPGKIFERDALMQSLGWIPDTYGEHRLEALISRLRKKVKLNCPEEPLPLKARHGSGYVFLATSEPE